MSTDTLTQSTSDIPVIELAALFASDLEPERIDLSETFGPAYAGCWIDIRAMDADAYARYLSSGQSVQIRQGKLQASDAIDVQIKVAEQELHLLTHTITDFCLRRKKKAHGGETVTEEISLAPRAGDGRNRFAAEIYKQLHPTFRAFLVQECQRVNGLTETLVGNLEESSSN